MGFPKLICSERVDKNRGSRWPSFGSCVKPVVVTINSIPCCKIHHPDAVKRRNAETDKRQQEKWDKRPFYNKAFLKNALDVQRSTDAEKARIYGQKNPEAFVYAQEIAKEIEKED